MRVYDPYALGLSKGRSLRGWRRLCSPFKALGWRRLCSPSPTESQTVKTVHNSTSRFQTNRYPVTA
jgi:hypothetical protein